MPQAPFTWPEAGSTGLRALIRRFNSFPLTVRMQRPLWTWLLQGGVPFGKFSRDWVEYSEKPVNGECCGNCNRRYEHGVTGTIICSDVRGVWKLQEHCNRWAPGQDAVPYRAYQEGATLPGGTP